MPPESSPELSSLEAFAAAGILAVIVYILLRVKALPSQALKTAPQRSVSLHLLDVAAIFILIFVGQMIYLLIDRLLGGPLIVEQVAGSNSSYRTGLWRLLIQLLTQGLPVCFILMRLSSEKDVIHFGLSSFDPERESGFALWGFLLAFMLVFPVNMLAMQIFILLGQEAAPIGHELLKEMQKGTDALPLQMISAILIAPILEEIIFRGIMQTALLNSIQKNTDMTEIAPLSARWTVILIASFVFSIVHYAAVPVYVLPGLMVLGVLLGWLYERTGTLWPSIFVHACFNAVNTGIILNPQVTSTTS